MTAARDHRRWWSCRRCPRATAPSTLTLILTLNLTRTRTRTRTRTLTLALALTLKAVEFSNHKIDLNGPTAQAMGEYTFTDATSGDKVNVYYSFCYKRNDDGKLRIYLHHSSLPYSAAPRRR